MNRIILLIFASLTFVGNAFAVDELRIADFCIAPGETKTISVELQNAGDSYIMLDFYLQLPDGLAINKYEDGELAVVPNDARFTKTHFLEVAEIEESTYRILIYSSRNAAIKGNSGELFSMTITADLNATAGIKQGRIYKQVFANVEEQEYDPVDMFFNITIGNVSLDGDVNGDGEVTIADVVAVVNYITTNGNPAGQFIASAADVDGVEGITIADAIAIVNMILNGGSSE